MPQLKKMPLKQLQKEPEKEVKNLFNKWFVVEHLHYTFLSDFLWDWLERGILR